MCMAVIQVKQPPGCFCAVAVEPATVLVAETRYLH